MGVPILVIDNYDSFTYNLVQYLSELGAEVEAVRNDAASVVDLRQRRPRGVVISPGPGRPSDAGVSVIAAREFSGAGIPVLGVCLGHQAIVVAFGGTIVGARVLMHGKTSPVLHDGDGVFRGLPSPLVATRYHSLAVDAERCPSSLRVSAHTPDGEIMGVRHEALPAEGVQFHPEAVLTQGGMGLLGNFLARCVGESHA